MSSQQQIIKALAQHKTLSSTDLYRRFHRWRAPVKNKILSDLLAQGIIVRSSKRNVGARKPVTYWQLA